MTVDELESHGVFARVCRACGIEKPISAYRATANKYGKLYADRKCKSCRGPQAQWTPKRRCTQYGITVDDFDRMAEQQQGRCAICERSNQELNIDHDHETGIVRGLLCNRCNTGMGRLGDNEVGLLKALDYLRKSKSTTTRE